MAEIDNVRAWISANFREPESSLLLTMMTSAQEYVEELHDLWVFLISHLAGNLKYSQLFDLLEMLVERFPRVEKFRLALAESAIKAGFGNRVPEILSPIRSGGAVGDEAERIRYMAGSEIISKRFESFLLDMANWRDEFHLQYVKTLIENRYANHALELLSEWLRRHPVQPDDVASVAEAALLTNEFPTANQLFQLDWVSRMNENAEQLLGEFPDQIPPYSQEVEDRLIERIERAFASDPPLPAYSLADVTPINRPVKVLFVSFSDRALKNDIAEHMEQSALQAGIDLTCHLDSALALLSEFVGSDDEIEGAYEKLGNRIRDLNPEIVIWDLIIEGTQSVTPGRIEFLRRLYGFRLLVFLRDPHKEARNIIHHWLPAVDGMLLPYAEAEALAGIDDTLGENVLILPIPTFYPLFSSAQEKDSVLVFAGAAFWKPRLPLFARLLSEPIPFKAVLGPRRAIETPDLPTYARFLARSRGVLNISRHGHDIHLMTGRVWETLAAGSVLVEQDNPITSRFFTPYRHYIPWKNITDIAHIAHFLQRRWDVAEQVALEGHGWGRQHFGCEGYWSKIIRHALRPLDIGRRQAQEEYCNNLNCLLTGKPGANWTRILSYGTNPLSNAGSP